MRHLKPREIQGCQLALDASIPGSLYDATSGGGLVAADGAVARWEDQSGNARHATQGEGTRQPLRRIAGLNGVDTLQFDGTNDQLVHGATSGSDPNTIFAVARATSTQTAYRGIASFGNSNSATGSMLLMRTGSSANFGSFGSADIASTYAQGTTGFAASIIDASGGAYSLHAQGTGAGSGVANNPSSQNVANVGGLAVTNPAQSTAMHCAQIAMYNLALSESVIRRLHGSGMRKWRING
jgi:hypothetical protein